MNTETPLVRSRPAFSIPSLIAIAAAIGSFATGAFFGLVLAVVAMIFGVIGILLSFSPAIRGGMVSVLSFGAGLLGLVAAGFKTISAIF